MMKRAFQVNFLFAAAVLALGGNFFPAAAQDAVPAESHDARLTRVSGDVVVVEPGGDEAGIPAAVGLPLQEGDRIRTGAEGGADISIDATSLVRLGPNSDFKLTNLQRSQTLFELKYGLFLAKIKKLLAAQSMQVRTSNAVAAVRGTEFGIEAPKDGEETHYGVFDEGKVEVKGPAGIENLIGDQETKVGADGKPAQPYQLQRLAKHRSAVRGFKRRIATLAKTWAKLSPEERAKLRRELAAKGRETRERKQEQRQREKGEKRKETEKMHKERAEMDRAREKARERSKH